MWRLRSRETRDRAWASRASGPRFSSKRLQLYQLVPCSDHRPMHIQQNSCLHLRHVMWLHPPFFSMVELHLRHTIVLADIQLAVSESSAHFFSHFLTNTQNTNKRTQRLQPKQKR